MKETARPARYLSYASQITMMTIQNKQVAFHKVQLHNTFGEYLAAHDMTQARIAETEKYAHVTFFFNGGVEEPNKGEDRILGKISEGCNL